MVLLLDVELDAPVLLMPLTSSSDDHIEVDLGTLQLSNRVVWEMHTDDKQKLLMDEMEVTKRLANCLEHLYPSRHDDSDVGTNMQIS